MRTPTAVFFCSFLFSQPAEVTPVAIGIVKYDTLEFGRSAALQILHAESPASARDDLGEQTGRTGRAVVIGLLRGSSDARPCADRRLARKAGGRWSHKTVRCGSRQALAQHGRETTQIARAENLSFQMLKDGMREDTVDFNTLRKPPRQEMKRSDASGQR